MDNPAFQNDNGVTRHPHPKKQLTRANSTLTPTTKSWHLTQAPRSKLCRYNSVLDTKTCCDDNKNNIDGPQSLDYPFFAKKSPSKNILSDHTMWTYNRLHDSPVFQKPGVSTIYDPQFLSSKFGYSGTHHSLGEKELKKEWWPGGLFGGFRWEVGEPGAKRIRTSQKVAALLCALVLTLLASGNVVYILRTVERPLESPNKSNWVDVVLITGDFRITNEPYRQTLANHSSEDFQQLSHLISQQLDSLFSLSVMSEPYHSVAVTQFAPGLSVQCQIVLRAATHLTASKVGLAFIGGLRNQHGHVWLGNFTVDIQSIGFQASNDAVSWTGWSEWGECQHTVEFGYVTLRSRNCSLRSGTYLYSTLPCLLVPHSDGNLETAPCASPETNQLSQYLNDSTQSQRMFRITKADMDIRNRPKNESTELNVAVAPETNDKNASGPCACGPGEVCVALQEHSVPQCLSILDTTDPTGCGGHCKINTQLCQKMRDNAYRCVDDSKCLEDEWQCGNKLCIPLSKRCDGHFNCYDHTDEFDCDCNLTSHFQCGKRMSCLPLSKRCDAIVDCWDAADELNCTIHCVGQEQFTCNDSQCIPNHRFCDGFPDCKDHSDEPFGCGGDCKTHEWKCSNSRCILQTKRCDGQNDCGDGSDEAECVNVTPE
ncbi:uncharacterized protein LOC128990218 isoform X1 [Macrosteles quadrilineatus]|uniref:uncharacterized protein LOC128990218 isoform X1 n=1 Tax=Macrosteles quadrilineatus TaxID=74068 RepID=UPI0023E1C12D|nr:uncharacterized protein LOC128990218 isoform X1 [Macrosteles quadrilineatus]